MDVPGYLHAHVHENIMMEKVGIERQRAWAVVLGLAPKREGNQWCILWGDNIQEGVCGFGETPETALWAFEEAMGASIPLTPNEATE